MQRVCVARSVYHSRRVEKTRSRGVLASSSAFLCSVRARDDKTSERASAKRRGFLRAVANGSLALHSLTLYKLN